MFATLSFEMRAHVAHLSLNRADAMNTMNLEMGRELMVAALRCADDADVRAVLLTGTGKAFCAGGDLRAIHAQKSGKKAYLRDLTSCLHTAISIFSNMNPPLVVAVNGTTAGAGIGLVAMADLAIAAKGAKFTLAYTAAGLTPDAGTTFFLPRLMGTKRAAELLLLNRTLSAQEAVEWGLVNSITDDAQLLTDGSALAERLAMGPLHAFGAVKRLLRRSGGLEAQLAEESREISDQSESAEGLEGVEAFLQKRKPGFN